MTPTAPGWHWYEFRNSSLGPRVVRVERERGRLVVRFAGSLGALDVATATAVGEWLGEALPPESDR